MEEQLTRAGCRLLAKWIADSNEPLYAAAFFGCYREWQSTLTLPEFAANRAAALSTFACSALDGFYDSAYWNPPDWLLMSSFESCAEATFTRLQEQLDDYSAIPGAWPEIEECFMACIVRSARNIYRHYAGHAGVSEDFVVFFADEEGAIPLAKVCMPVQLQSLFHP